MLNRLRKWFLGDRGGIVGPKGSGSPVDGEVTNSSELLSAERRSRYEALEAAGRRDGALAEPLSVPPDGLSSVLRPLVAQFEDMRDIVVKAYNNSVKAALRRLKKRLDRRIFVGHEDFGREQDGGDLGTVHEYEMAMDRVVEEGNREIDEDLQKELDGRSAWKKFCEKHGLTLVLEHEVRYWEEHGAKRKGWGGWEWLFGAWVLESLINGLFFISQNPDGGWGPVAAPAFLFSAVNMFGFVLILGTAWRYRTYYKDVVRKVAWAGLFVFGLFCVLFNLGVAHYRDAVAPDFPAEGTACYVEGNPPGQESTCLFWKKMIVLGEWEAYGFFLIGILFVLLGVWKLTDRVYHGYPGYRNVIMSYIAVFANPEKKFREVMTRLEDKYGEWVEKFGSSIKEDWQSASDVVGVPESKDDDRIPEDRQGLKGDVDEMYDQCLRDFYGVKRKCEKAVNIYIEANKEVRPGHAPYPPEWDVPWKALWEEPTSLVIPQLRPYKEVEEIYRKEREFIDKNLTVYYKKAIDKVHRPSVIAGRGGPPYRLLVHYNVFHQHVCFTYLGRSSSFLPVCVHLLLCMLRGICQ